MRRLMSSFSSFVFGGLFGFLGGWVRVGVWGGWRMRCICSD